MQRRTDLDELKRSPDWPYALFLDDGGVLNDNGLRSPEWNRLIGEFMPARMGGTPEEWMGANRVVFPQVWRDIQMRLPHFAGYQEFQRVYATGWMDRMCARIGLAPPSGEDSQALYRELSIYVSERAHSAIPGSVEAVNALRRAGFRLYTASGTPSWELRGIMTTMGIAEAFSALYGPDVVDHVKYGPGFYREIFAHAGVPAGRALVIDSDSDCCLWGCEAGAHAVWIDAGGEGDQPTLKSLADALL